MKKLFLFLSILISVNCQAQWIKIYSNGGCIMAIDSSTQNGICSNIMRFSTRENTQKVYVTVGNRDFPERTYIDFKNSNGTNLASSHSDLLTKLGVIQASVLNSQTVTTTPVNISYSCLPITSVTVYAASTYKEISIAPVNSGTYTLQTGANTANTGLFNIATLKGDSGGLISNIVTITPTGGSTITVCTKQ